MIDDLYLCVAESLEDQECPFLGLCDIISCLAPEALSVIPRSRFIAHD